jgi:hypothetical protein
VAVVFAPPAGEMYAAGHSTVVQVAAARSPRRSRPRCVPAISMAWRAS